MMKKSISALGTLSAILLATTSCSTSPKGPAAPKASVSDDPNIESIVILGLNDIHGALAPQPAKTKEPEGVERIPYERGGVTYLASHIRLLRKEYGPRLLVLDAGDEFQGSIESNLHEGAPMVQVFNELGVNAAAVGNHEFDFGPVGPEGTSGDPLGALKARMLEAKFPYVASNIVEKSTGRMPALPNTVPRLILTAGRVKVGIIGLSTLDTPTTTRGEYVRDLTFTDLKDATLREAAALRKEGAEVIVVTAHVGLKCEPGRAGLTYRIHKPTDQQGPCNPKDEMVRYLRSLPAGTVDAVVSGHSHQVVHHWVNGIPVIQGGTRAHYYNLIHLAYDRSQKKVVPELTQIEGAIPVCPKVFKNQQDCNGDRPAPSKGRGNLVPAMLYGTTIKSDSRMEDLLDPVFAQSEKEKKRVLGRALQPLDHSRVSEGALGNFIADAIREKLETDVALMNAGGIRASIEQGPITYEDVFRALPFDNAISRVKVTGKELKSILRIAESGARGFFPVSGLKLKLLDPTVDALSTDLNKDGKIQPWEVNRLLEATLEDGSPIEDKKVYTLGTIDFLVGGGDDLGWIMSQIPAERIELTAGGVLRDTVIEAIEKKKEINSAARPVLTENNSRMQFLKKRPRQSRTRGNKGRRTRGPKARRM